MGAALPSQAQFSAGIVEFSILLTIYLVPTIVAVVRQLENPWPTIVVDVFLGWTFVGWVVALAMAVGGRVKPPG